MATLAVPVVVCTRSTLAVPVVVCTGSTQRSNRVEAGAPKSLTLAEELVTVEDCQERETKFGLGVWSL